MRHPLAPRRLLAAVPLGFAGVCVLAASSAPAAAEQARNGLVAFSGVRAGTRVLYTRASNGTRLRVVPAGGTADHPAFSARGKRLVFTRYGSLGAQLWVTYLNGTGLRQLTTGPRDGMAEWSPTGDQVVFARGRRGRRDIYRVVADGTGLRQLTFDSRDDYSPSWSVRNQIAFVRATGGRSHVYVLPAAGGTPRRLTRGKASDVTPAWSPTGRRLAFARGRPGRRDLFLVSADGVHVRRLTKVPGDESEPAWSPDGSRIVFTYRRKGRSRIYLMKVRGGVIRRLPARSRRVRRLTSSRSRSRLPSWQPAGLAPVVAAGGDIACDPGSRSFNGGLGVPDSCRQKLTSDLLLRMDLSAVLALGDNQYEDGQLSKFQRSFNPSWGRLKPLIRPVPGNHEYGDPGAAGYFDYFNGLGRQDGIAGDRNGGYYSFNIGTWHVIALNSECKHIGGCGAGSPQMNWLRTDLAAHPALCTVALWHRPHFTSGGHTDAGNMLPAWVLLYAANADLILNGHDHLYERFGPQTPAAAPDPARGIREFIVGTGGKSRFAFTSVQPNSQVRTNDFYGVLGLTLRDGTYDWSFQAAPSGRVVDAGSGTCH